MTKKGEVTRALSAGTVANFMGTVPSILIAMIACPVISKFAVKMGPWEYFALGLMAITLGGQYVQRAYAERFYRCSNGLFITQIGLCSDFFYSAIYV